jgi:hypothetical protein
MLYLELFNDKVPVQTELRETILSKHTGTELNVIEVSLTFRNENGHRAFLDIIRDNKIISSVDEEDHRKKWKISNSSYTYSNDSGPYRHTLELTEQEVLSIEKLVINGLSFQPYFYKESIDEDSLIIDARILLTPEEYENFKKIRYGELYFPVVRVGISEQEKEMRFGQGLWSQNDGKIKQHICLVERSYDITHKKRVGLYPEIPNIMEMLEDNIEIMDNLLNILSQKNVLTDSELQQVKEISTEKVRERRLLFYRIDDIDAIEP